MTDGEINAVRLLHLAMDDPVWQTDLPALMRGAMLRQTQGHWQTHRQMHGVVRHAGIRQAV